MVPSVAVALNHFKLIVGDLDRSVKFYCDAFGMELLERDPARAILTTPGHDDILTLGQAGEGEEPGLDHLGFLDRDVDEFDATVARVERAGGRLLRRSTIDDRRPTAFFADPDGFVIQV